MTSMQTAPKSSRPGCDRSSSAMNEIRCGDSTTQRGSEIMCVDGSELKWRRAACGLLAMREHDQLSSEEWLDPLGNYPKFERRLVAPVLCYSQGSIVSHKRAILERKIEKVNWPAGRHVLPKSLGIHGGGWGRTHEVQRQARRLRTWHGTGSSAGQRRYRSRTVLIFHT